MPMTQNAGFMPDTGKRACLTVLLRCIVRLGTLLPFEQVPEQLAFLTGVCVLHCDLDTRIEQLHYASFQAKDYPIASGTVESGNKLVVDARLKGAGMHRERGTSDKKNS